MCLKKAACFLLILSFNFIAKAQTADEVIAKYLAFTGGEQRWKKIKSIVSTGIYNYGGLQFPFKSYSKSPDLYKFVVTLKGKYYAQAFDGKKGWKIDVFKDETKKTLLTGKAALAMSNEADVELENPFINYTMKGHQAALEGKDTIEGTICFRVKFIKKNSDTESYFFNSEDFKLVKKIAVSKNAELENAMLDTFYGDYRVVHGFKIPFKSVSKSNNQTILTITLRKIEFNLPISDTIFDP